MNLNTTIGDLVAQQLGSTPTETTLDTADTGGAWAPMIGRTVLIRTVTMTLVGTLIGVHPQELVLRDAAWIAMSHRWSVTVATGEVDEVEPFPDGLVIVGRGAVIDACAVPWSAPRVAS